MANKIIIYNGVFCTLSEIDLAVELSKLGLQRIKPVDVHGLKAVYSSNTSEREIGIFLKKNRCNWYVKYGYRWVVSKFNLTYYEEINDFNHFNKRHD